MVARSWIGGIGLVKHHLSLIECRRLAAGEVQRAGKRSIICLVDCSRSSIKCIFIYHLQLIEPDIGGVPEWSLHYDDYRKRNPLGG